MKVSLKWLNEYLDNKLDLSDENVAKIVEQTEITSTEIESNEKLADGQDSIVIAKVKSVVEHPDSDHMHIVMVDDGNEELRQIVTGAGNVAEGQTVILAKAGGHVRLGNTGEIIKLKPVKLRGEKSTGMLVALQEIGFSDSISPKDFEEGIYVFTEEEAAKLNAGDDALEVLGMYEPVIDTDLTPNRADMLSMLGTAYEFGAMLDIDVNEPDIQITDTNNLVSEELEIANVDEALAEKYFLRVVKNVEVKESPLWLQKHLWNAGIRPINNVVDITNYLMLLYGQPLHAFDLDKLNAKKIDVRLAKENETLTTLDGKERTLAAGEDLIIVDGDEPIMLAGVMGGMSTEVDNNTRNIVIESAIFNPSLVRKTAKKHELHSQASHRFERGINPVTVKKAINHAAILAEEIAGGKVVDGILVGVDKIDTEKVINISVKDINNVLGTDLSAEDVKDILRKLKFEYSLNDEAFKVILPNRRVDLEIKADLIEEIARIYGYNNIPATLPYGESTKGFLSLEQKQRRASRQILESLGYNEAISYALTTEEKAKMFTDSTAELVKLDYPMSTDHTVARQNLIAGLVDDVLYNKSRTVTNVALYEQGRVFFSSDDQLPTEDMHVAAILTGQIEESTWEASKQSREVNYYDIKGALELYLSEMGVNKNAVHFQANKHIKNMHPGRTANVLINNKVVGFVGQIHPELTLSLKANDMYVFELNFDDIVNSVNVLAEYKAVSKYPQVTRDVALLVSTNIYANDIIDLIQLVSSNILSDVKVFDLYEGANLGPDKKSLAFNLTYKDDQGTLTEEVVNEEFNKLTAALLDTFDAEIR